MYLDNGSLIRRLFLAHRCGLASLLRVLVGALLLAGYPLAAQSQPAQEIPTVEPSLTRLLGSDDLFFTGYPAISPDGRWLVFQRPESEAGATTGARERNLWIAPLDGTGDPTPLTWGSYPLWFPSGDRILFRTSRPDLGGGLYLSTLDIDPSNGQARGLPRQLTLETVEYTRSFDISPDGEEVVYAHRSEDPGRAGHVLKIIPARGGNARTVGTYPIVRPIWADDGFIYGSGEPAPALGTGWDRGFSIRRVPAAGGEAEVLSNWPSIRNMDISPDGSTIVYRLPNSWEAAVYEVASVHGQRLARFTLPDNMVLEGCFTRDALECLAVTTDGAAPLKVIPINGGPTRQLTESHVNTQPLGWTPDGREVVFGWELNGTGVIMSAPATGRVMEELHSRLQGEWVYGPSMLKGRFVLHGVEDGSDGTIVLRILDLHTGSEREITRTPWVDYTRYNRSRTEDRFLYAERKEGRFEFRAVDPEGVATFLRAFPDTVFPVPLLIGVHGDRIAYWTRTRANDRSTLYLAQAGEDEALTVLHFPGKVGQRTQNPPNWSPDGRYLVTGYQHSEHTLGREFALVVEIDESGEAVGNPWVVEGLPSGWEKMRWMPDSEGFLVEDGSNVWLASIHGDVPPVNLTQEETGSIWFYQLSPDGRHIAVSPWVRMGGSLWRVDLEEVLAGYRR